MSSVVKSWNYRSIGYSTGQKALKDKLAFLQKLLKKINIFPLQDRPAICGQIPGKWKRIVRMKAKYIVE